MRGGGRGDQYVEVSVETPTNLTERQRELLRDFEKEEQRHRNSDSNYPIVHKFLDRLKELFG